MERNPMYRYNKEGKVVARLVHTLSVGECPCHWENKPNHFTDGNKVFEKVNW